MKKRIEKIRDQIKTEGKVTVSDLSHIYNVTEETIRRDLEKLEAEGVLTRTFGGAILNVVAPGDQVHFYKRASIHSEEKKVIGQLTARFIADMRTIVADSSSTVMAAIKEIPSDTRYTILSSSTEIFREIGETKIKLISTGGLYNPRYLSLYGSQTRETISKFHPEIALVSCKGLDERGWITDSSEEGAETKTVMIRQAGKAALLIDNSKFGKVSFVEFSGLENIDYVITDSKPEDKWLKLLEKYHITVIYPGNETY